MAVTPKFKNKRRWQEIGAAALLTCIIALPTMAVVAYAPDLFQEWRNVRQVYGSATAYSLVAIFVILAAVLAVPGVAFAWQTRGSLDWLLGKSDQDGANESRSQ